MPHAPVLLEETIRLLDPRPGDLVVDGTFGGGGHAKGCADRMRGTGTILGIDWNEEAVLRAKRAFGEKLSGVRLIVVQENFRNIPTVLADRKLPRANALLLDLGISSNELTAGIGLSFKDESASEPLDMRYGKREGESAADVVNRASAETLERIFREYGEERYAGRIVERIVRERKKKHFETVGDLTAIVRRSVPAAYERGRLHPATRVFQALRIFVNGELENLEATLRSLPEILAPHGRVAVISFHSLEDRMTKNVFKQFAASEYAKLLTKKPIVPGESERKENPRSRSAKLRALEFISSREPPVPSNQ